MLTLVECSWQRAKQTYGVLDWAQTILPMIGWLRVYNIKKFLIVSFRQ